MPYTFSIKNFIGRRKSKKNGFNNCWINLTMPFIYFFCCLPYCVAYFLDRVFCGCCPGGARQLTNYSGGKERKESTDVEATSGGERNKPKKKKKTKIRRDEESGESSEY